MPRLLGRSRSLSLIVVATLGSTAALTAQYGSDFEALEVTASPTTPFAPALWDPSAVAGTPGQAGYPPITMRAADVAIEPPVVTSSSAPCT